MPEILLVDEPVEEVRSALRDEYGDDAANLHVSGRPIQSDPFSLDRKGEGTAIEAVVKLAEAIAVGAAGSAANDLLMDAARRLRARFGNDRVRQERDDGDPETPPAASGGSAEPDHDA